MAEKATVELNVKTDDSQKSLRAMRQEMKQLQIAMDQASDPAEFKRLEAEFAILRNDMRDTSTAMKYLDPGELLGGWTKMAQGAVGSFAAVTGAMSLFGNESEEIQEIERKSMALIQTMMGLEQARQLLIDGGGKAERKTLLSSTAAWIKKTLGIGANTATTAANTAGTVANTAVTGAQTVATTGATIATKLLGAAMKALPIFAIIGAVVGLVSIMKNLFGSTKENTAASEAYTNTLSALNDKLAQNKKYTDDVAQAAEDAKIRMLVATGQMTQAEADKLAAVQEYNDSYSKSIETAAGEYAAIMATYRAAEKKAQEAYDNEMAKGHDHFLEASRDADLIRQSAIRERDKALEKSAADHSNRIVDIEKKKSDDIAVIDAEEAKRKADESRRWWEAYNSSYRSWMDKVKDMQISFIADDEEREIAKIEEERARQERSLRESELYKAKFYDKDKEKARLEEIAKIEAAIVEDAEKKKNDVRDKYAKDAREKEQKRQDELLAIMMGGLENVSKYATDAEDKLAADLAVIRAKAEDDKKKTVEKNAEDSLLSAEELAAKLKLIDDTAKLEAQKTQADYDKQVKEDARQLAMDLLNIRSENAATAKERRDAEIEKLDAEEASMREKYEGNEAMLLEITEKYARLRATVEEQYIKDMIDKYSDYVGKIADGFSSVFSNLTEIAQMELDYQDKMWQDSWEARYGGMEESLKKMADIYGQDSEEYKQALKEKEDADKIKADHDKIIADQKKAAENKYKKAIIASDMAKTTAEFAKATAAIWFGETATKLELGIPLAIALQAMIAGVYGTQMAVMAKQMALVGKMRLGGPVFGPSHESGGVNRELEGGEFVINAQSMKVPGVARLASQLNRVGSEGAVPGGLDERTVRTIVEDTVSGIAAIPVVVSERDITGTQRRVKVIESKTNF